MSLPSMKSSCLKVVVTQGELSSLVPSPLPELPKPLNKEMELLTVTGLGPVKIASIKWTWPRAPSPNSQEFSEFLEIVTANHGSDFWGAMSWRTGGMATPSGLAEVWRPEPGTWRFLIWTWRLGRYQGRVGPDNLSGVIEDSSIVHHDPADNYTCALRFFKKHVVTEVSYLGDPSWNSTEVAVYDKIDDIQLPEEEDTEDWTEDAWNERIKKVNEEEQVMKEEDMAVEDGWAALPFAPELQPLACGLFLASSVEYSWPGYFPGGDLWQVEVSQQLLRVPKVVKVTKEGNSWKLLDFCADSESLLLTGEGDSVVKSGLDSMRFLASGQLLMFTDGLEGSWSCLASVRILASGQLLLTRKILASGLAYGGPDFKGASYSLYSPL